MFKEDQEFHTKGEKSIYTFIAYLRQKMPIEGFFFFNDKYNAPFWLNQL